MKQEIDIEKSDGYFIISLDGNIIKKDIKDFPANHPMLLAVIKEKVPPMKTINIVENNLEFVLIKKEINLVYKNKNEIIDKNFRNNIRNLPENKIFNSKVIENAINYFYIYNKNEKNKYGSKSSELLYFAKTNPNDVFFSPELFDKYTTYFYKYVIKNLFNINQELVLCCVPSHNECDYISNVMSHVIKHTIKKFNDDNTYSVIASKKIYDGSNVLYRKYEVPKSSISHEKRSYSRQYDSLGVRNKELIKDKNVLLIDDIYTSGASMHACKEKLLENGAKKVYLFAYARTRSDFYG